MNPTQIRNESFVTLRDSLNAMRREVLVALAQHGPCTTRQLAERSGRDILTVRPRVTELCELGLVLMDGRAGHEGIYRIASQAEWEVWRERLMEEQTTGQLQML